MTELSTTFWHAFTRLGEAQLLLPAAMAVYAWTVWRSPAARASAHRWLASVAIAAGLTTLTKVAFIGFGVGSAALDFTGLSGHAMFSAGILPVLAGLLMIGRDWAPASWAIGVGYGLAVLVGISRVMVEAHSVSETVGGLLCGGLASALALRRWRPWPFVTGVPAALVIGIPLALVVGMQGAPASRTHDWVTRLSLQLSGRTAPCTRADLHDGGCRRGTPQVSTRDRSRSGLPPSTPRAVMPAPTGA